MQGLITKFNLIFFSLLLISCSGGTNDSLPKTDESVPVVQSIQPTDGQLDVAVTDTISISFNEDVTKYDSTSIVIQKYKINGTLATPFADPVLSPINYKNKSNTVIFTPRAGILEINSKYRILIRNIEDKATNAMAEKSWVFETITNPTAKIKPADGDRGISPASDIRIEFSEPMDISTLMQINSSNEQNPRNFTLSEAGILIPNENILISYNAKSNIASYKIKKTTANSYGFKKSTSYTVVLSTLATDANSIRLLSENSSTFITGFNIGTGTPPTAPTTVSVTTNNGNANITWDAVTGNNVTYNLYSTTDNWLTQTPISQGLTGQNTQISINPDIPYKFGISGVEDNNESLITSSAEVIYVLAPISPPRNVKAVVGDAEVTLTWGAPANSTGLKFNVYLSKDNKKTYQKIATTLTGGYFYQRIANNALYHFAITSVDSTEKQSIKVLANNNIGVTPKAVGTKIAAWNHTCVIRDNGKNQSAGSIWCWGKNKNGQLGIGIKTPSEKPVQVGTVPAGSTLPAQVWNDWVAVSVGEQHSCGIRKVNGLGSGLLYCWGYNFYGQLGLGVITATTDTTIPRLVKLPTSLTSVNWTKITAGPAHSCAIHSDTKTKTISKLFCWGSNNSGQLGNTLSGATTPNVLQPEAVTGVNNDWIEISAGGRRNFSHTCGIRQETPTNTTLWCWGARRDGQLGDNRPTSNVANLVIPTQEYKQWTDWTSIATGLYHSCAIRAELNNLWCWGGNSHQQLGNIASGQKFHTLIQESSYANDWIKVFAKSYSTCGLKVSGLIKCWGRNELGQTGTYPSEFGVPSTTLLEKTWTEIAIGTTHTCGLKISNNTFCWGSAERYKLGNTTAETATPVRVLNVDGAIQTNFTDVSVTAYTYTNLLNSMPELGNHTIALQTPSLSSKWSSLTGWGNNVSGQGGKHVFNNKPIIPNNGSSTPIDSQLWKKISTVTGLSCAILATDDTLWCWGSVGLLFNSPNKLKQIGTERWHEISVARTHICGVKLVVDELGNSLADDQSLWCWGQNYAGELGIGSNTANEPMTKVLSPLTTPVKWLSVEVVNDTTCAITTTNDLYCWGGNGSALLGNGNRTNSNRVGKNKPNPVLSPIDPAVTKWKKIQIGNGDSVACGLTLSPVSNELYCWGQNIYGQAGTTGTILMTPTKVTGGSGFWTGFDVGASHSCAIDATDSTLWCWGNNAYGQLGNTKFDNDPIDSKSNPTPQKIVLNPGFITTWSKVATGGQYTCAIRTDSNFNTDVDTLWCWGRNTHGQLGNNNAWSLNPKAVTIP